MSLPEEKEQHSLEVLSHILSDSKGNQQLLLSFRSQEDPEHPFPCPITAAAASLLVQLHGLSLA